MQTYQLKIKVLGVDFPFSRTITVPDNLDFFDLHTVITIVFGLDDEENDYEFKFPFHILVEYDEVLRGYLKEGVIFQYKVGVWNMEVVVEKLFEYYIETPQLINYEWTYQLNEYFSDLYEYMKLIELIEKNPLMEIEDENGLKNLAMAYVFFDQYMINEELAAMFDDEDDELFHGFGEFMDDQIAIYSQVIREELQEFDIHDQLIYMKEENCWLWMHTGEHVFHLYTSDPKEIIALWNASRNHDIIDERYFSGLQVCFDEETDETYVFDYSGNERTLVEEPDELPYYFELLDNISDRIIDTMIPYGVELKAGQYIEINDSICSYHTFSLELQEEDLLPVNDWYKEFKEKTQSKETLKMILENVRQVTMESNEYVTYLLVKGRHFQEYQKISSYKTKEIAKEVVQYLCKYLEHNPRPKVILFEDKNVSVYLKYILDELDIQLHDELTDKDFDEAYYEAFNEVNPIREEERAAMEHMQGMNEFELEEYLETLPLELSTLIIMRMMSDPEIIHLVTETKKRNQPFFMN